MLAGMLKGVKAEFYAASSREPDVYRGRPFQIEAAIAFGGELPAEETGRVIRYANRVPLLFQQSACSSFKSCTETSWRNYNLSQPRGSLPQGPIVIMIHMASVWVPFTSESKEAIADYDEIRQRR
jgi:DNA topoisomerase-6 subunit B